MAKANLRMNNNSRHLKGCTTKQLKYVTIEITPEDSHGGICEISLSMAQFAELMSSNGEVTCTIDRAFDSKGNNLKEIIEEPKSIRDEMIEDMGEAHGQLANRIRSAKDDVYEMVNGKANKTKLKELLKDIEVIESHFKSNAPFYLEEAAKKVERESEEKRIQILGEINNLVGGSMNENQKDTVLKVLKSIEGKSTLQLPESTGPVFEKDYQEKIREIKNVDDMTSMEVADTLHMILRKMASEEKNKSHDNGSVALFVPSVSEAKKGVKICYVSYQGSRLLELDKAKEYLKALMESDTFFSHYSYFRK